MQLKPWFERVSIACQLNSRWYSRRGARRGLGLALLAGSLWLGWALGYLQTDRSRVPPKALKSNVLVTPPCCNQRVI